ncbi:MAG: DUF2927 domain-containing protein [Gemmobacter sp.]|nr:DUF2927 domain-containing protein [Gemmobacter sp.]
MPRLPALMHMIRLCATLATVAGVAGCALTTDEGGTKSSPRPMPRAAVPVAPPEPSAASLAVKAHFNQVQADLLARGLLRRDGGGPDTPFSERQLVENFVRIGLYDEYVSEGGRLVARQSPAALRRWDGPVRISVRFGAQVPEDQRTRDRASVSAFADRLARVSGHSIRVSDANPNYFVYILSEDERSASAGEWAGLFPGLNRLELDIAAQLPLSTFCLVLAISEGDRPVYSNALAVIRSELPDLLRLSCIHEEIAQGLGLANDHPQARPSIFNDDEEFATLTRHDELLLKMLYDARLTPGMREAEARPILRVLATEILGGES